jgi:hypothetical protein
MMHHHYMVFFCNEDMRIFDSMGWKKANLRWDGTTLWPRLRRKRKYDSIEGSHSNAATTFSLLDDDKY